MELTTKSKFHVNTILQLRSLPLLAAPAPECGLALVAVMCWTSLSVLDKHKLRVWERGDSGFAVIKARSGSSSTVTRFIPTTLTRE